MSDERVRILEMINSGVITAEQGLALIKAMEEDDSSPAETVEAAQPASPILPETVEPPAAEPAKAPEAGEAQPESPSQPAAAEEEEVFAPEPEDPPQEAAPLPTHSEPPSLAHYRSFWRIPVTIGLVITILAAILMFLAYQDSEIGFWFACTWFPFLLGVLILSLGWASHYNPWLHLRIRQKPGSRPEKISISFPLPVGLVHWVMPFFRDKIPARNGVDPVEMIGLLKNVSPDKPLYIEVDEPGGEHVEIYIG